MDDKTGTFAVGTRHKGRVVFDSRYITCTKCGKRNPHKGGHYIDQNLSKGRRGKFCCDDCWKKEQMK